MNLDSSRMVVLIPAYNEAPRLPAVLEAIGRRLPACDRLVIDDGSTDATVQVATQANAIVISHPFNLGYGVALQTGYKYAVEHGYAYLLQMDADGQHDPSYLPQLSQALSGDNVNMVIGSRRLSLDSYVPPLLRRLGMRFFAWLTSLCIGQRISDPTSGFKGFKRSAFPLLVSDYFPMDYPDADVIIMIHRAGLRIAEIPVAMKSAPDKISCTAAGNRSITFSR